MCTHELRVGCRVFCADYHNPVVLAKETRDAGHAVWGRVEAGLGAGWVTAEYEGLGIAMERPGVRIERLAETVEVLKAHWAGEPLDIRHVRPGLRFCRAAAAGAAAASAGVYRRGRAAGAAAGLAWPTS